MSQIVLYPDPRLTQRCEGGPTVEELDPLFRHLSMVMLRENAVGLAANQIGLTVRFLVWRSPQGIRGMADPTITQHQGTQKATEGCLSFPGVCVETLRSANVLIRYTDLCGDLRLEWFSGFEAVVLQHEIDHLDGKVFVDRGVREGSDPTVV